MGTSSPQFVASSSSLPFSSAKTQTHTRKKIQTRIQPISQSDSDPQPLRCISCPCRRRHLIGASLLLLPPPPPSNSNAAAITSVSQDEIDKFHPQRPDWYQEFYAQALDQGMRSYEAQIAVYKDEIFAHLRGEGKKVVELGVGTGPNFKYYVSAADLDVIGVDPNKTMERYARAAAAAAGLPPANFTFMRGVGEALPLGDNSMDAVIGTLVLCSVKDVDVALKEVKRVLKPGGLYLFIEHVAASDGSFLRLTQSLLDPLQQFVSDGCHLTRETGRKISEVGFSSGHMLTGVMCLASGDS